MENAINLGCHSVLVRSPDIYRRETSRGLTHGFIRLQVRRELGGVACISDLFTTHSGEFHAAAAFTPMKESPVSTKRQAGWTA